MDGKIKYGVSFLAIIALMIFVWLNSRIPGNLEALSPMEAADLYHKASFNGNTELLAKLIYFPPGTTEQQKQKRINSSNYDNSPQARAILSMVGLKSVAKYEKIFDNDSAEVGICGKSGGKSSPQAQIILKKDQGVWKYHHNNNNFTSTSELVEAIKKNPKDASLYYYYSLHMISANPYRACKCYKKYYELEPDGFWVTDSMLRDIKEIESITAYETKLLSGDPPPGNWSDVYIKIGLAFAECGDYERADDYYNKAEEVFRKYPGIQDRLIQARKELQLRKSGKYIDVLELD